MTTDRSAGHRDGFERWVATMKRDHQPVAPRATPLNPKAATPSTPKPSSLEKLELELDDQATHVHRIPKELINRMREREQEREQAKRPEEDVQPSHEHEFPSDDFSGMATLNDDRTAVFRPPPELLARAKRMRPPAKPNPQSEAPTKPPPAPMGDQAGAGPAIPAAPMMPVIAPISTAPVARSTPLVPAGARLAPMTPMPAKAPPTPMPARVVPVAPVVVTEPREALSAAVPVAALEPPVEAPASPRTSEVIPRLIEPTAYPVAGPHAAPEPPAPRSEVAPSSADLATAFSTDASVDSSSLSRSAVRTLGVSEAPPGLGPSLARWVVAFLVAAAVCTSLIVWLRR
jgi:hypothetical protein